MLATVLTWRNLTIYLSLNKALSINLSSSFSGIEIQSQQSVVGYQWQGNSHKQSLGTIHINGFNEPFSINNTEILFDSRVCPSSPVYQVNRNNKQTQRTHVWTLQGSDAPIYIYPSLTHPPHTHSDRTSRRNHATNPFGFIFRFAQTVQRRTNDSSRTPSTIPPTPTA